MAERGGPDVLQWELTDACDPAAGQARIRIWTAGVSYADMLMREGVHPEKTPLPFTPGWDFVGEIDKLGDDGSRFHLGQMVAGLPIQGGYAQHICLAEAEMTPVPEGLDPAEAVCLILNYVTAYQMLHRLGHASKGQRVLIHAAAGGIGTALLELGRLVGLQMYGTASKSGFDTVSKYGGIPIDYESTDFVDEIRRLTGDGVDFVFDGIGGTYVWRSFKTLRPRGKVITFGLTASLRKGELAGGLRYRFRGLARPALYSLLAFFSPGGRRISLYSIQNLRRLKPAWFDEDLRALFDLLREEKIKPIIAQQIPLHEARRAHELLGEGSVLGKIVLRCDDTKTR
ncbi:MAG: medium chain dehydrogenase/reductase family protein [Methyloceanibacter sp.]|nr:medium chain dehydrogenase/reductase family protein [Methyloceanibacter sp.]